MYTEKHLAPKCDDKTPFFITEYGKTFADTPCYQLRMASPISCIQYVVAGSGIIICDDRIYTANKGDTFLLPEGKNQIYYSNPDNQFERIWINFTGELANALIDIYRLQDTVIFKNTDTSEILERIQTVCAQNHDPKLYKEETAREFLKLIQLLADHREDAPCIPNAIEEIRLYLDLHITENLKLSNIAKHFSFSKEHIIRVFKHTYGITPHQYILQSKIRIAMGMLKTTDDTIHEIASKLNFSNPHHFSEAFKTLIGFRPSEYRKASRT